MRSKLKLAFDELEKELTIITQSELAQLMGGNGYSTGLTASSSIDDVVNYFTGLGFSFTEDSNGNYFLGNSSFQIEQLGSNIIGGFQSGINYDEGGSGDSYQDMYFQSYEAAYLHLFYNEGYSLSQQNPNPNNCFPSTYEGIYNKVYGGSSSGFGETHYNSTYFDMNMGYGYPNPSLNGSDELVAYNVLKNTFDNVSAYKNINNIYNAGLSGSGNTAVFLNLHGGKYGDGHSVELYRTEIRNGVRSDYIIDRQNLNESTWYTENEIVAHIHSAFVIGDQDGTNQSANPFYQRQYNYNYDSIFSD